MEVEKYLDKEKKNQETKYEDFYIKPENEEKYIIDEGLDDEYHAVESGIGSGEDLRFSPKEIKTKEKFKYSAQLLGTEEEEIKIYPEINFSYKYWTEGKIIDDYNEENYAFNVYAYPPIENQLTIKQIGLMNKKVEYELKMNIKSGVYLNELRYGINFKLSQETETKQDIKSKFDTGAANGGEFVGYKKPGDDNWKIEGEKLKGQLNSSSFLATVSSTDYDKKNYKIKYKYVPIKTKETNGTMFSDNDFIGFIFKCQNDKKNFYLFGMLREGDNSSSRINENFGKGEFDITKVGQNINNKPLTSLGYFMDPEGPSIKSWNGKNRRLFKVENNIIKEIKKESENGINKGWEMEKEQEVTIVSSGKRVQIYIGSESKPTYDFETVYEKGSYGVGTVSQGVIYSDIIVTDYIEKSGRWPSAATDDWMQYKGKGIEKYANGINCEEIIKEEAKRIAENKKYLITSITPIKDSSTRGSVSGGLKKPLTLDAYNNTESDSLYEENHKFKESFSLSAKNNSKSNALIKIADVYKKFEKEINGFREKYREGTNEKIEFKIEVKSGKDVKHDIDEKKILFWADSFEKKEEEKNITIKLYEYENKKIVFSTKSFGNYDYTRFEAKFKSTNENLKGQWRIKKEESVVENHHDEYIVWVLNEKYQGEFEKENEGIVNSRNTKVINMPLNFKNIVNGKLLKNEDEVHYVLEQEKNEMITISFEDNKSETKSLNLNKKIYVKAKPEEKVLPFKSRVFYGYAKVNGKKPFIKNYDGKEDNVIYGKNHDVETRQKIIELEYIVEVNDDRVKFDIDKAKGKEIRFYSDYIEDFRKIKKWKDSISHDSREFETDENGILILDPLNLNILDKMKTNDKLRIESVKVKSNNPFVEVSAEIKKSANQGIIGTYYEWLRYYQTKKVSIEVKGTYREFEERFNVVEDEDYVDFSEEKEVIEYFFGGEIKQGKVEATSLKKVKEFYIEEGKNKFCIAATTIDNISLYYCDLLVVSPKGEEFGFVANNGTWSEYELNQITENSFGEDFESCEKYSFSGDLNISEWMIFENPVGGAWEVYIDNPLEEEIEYKISSNTGNKEEEFKIYYDSKDSSLVAKINDTDVTFNQDGKTLSLNAPFEIDDLIAVEYITNEKIINNNLRYEFELRFAEAKIIKVLDRNEEEIPLKTGLNLNGYTFGNGILEIHGTNKKQGLFYVFYSIGEVEKSFYLKQKPQLYKKVFINDLEIDNSQYSILDKMIHLNEGVAKKSDVLTVIWKEEINEELKSLEKTNKLIIGRQKEDNLDKDFSIEFPDAGDLIGLDLNTSEKKQKFIVDLEIVFFESDGTEIERIKKEKQYEFIKEFSSTERESQKEDLISIEQIFKKEIELFKEEKKLSDTQYLSINKKAIIISKNPDVYFLDGISREKETEDFSKKINFEILNIPEKEQALSSHMNLDRDLYITKSYEEIGLFRKESVGFFTESEERIENQYLASWSGYLIPKKSGQTRIIVNTKSSVQMLVNKIQFINPNYDKKSFNIDLKKENIYEIKITMWVKDLSESKVCLEWITNGVREVIPKEYLKTDLSYYIEAKVKEDVPKPWIGEINNGYYYMQEEEFYMFGKKQRSIVDMIGHLPLGTTFNKDLHNFCLLENIKNEGSPIIIRNSEGEVFEKQAFYEGYEAEEYQSVRYILTGKNYINFPYKNIDVESIEIKRNGMLLTKNTDYNIDMSKKRIEIYDIVEKMVEIDLKWKNKNSYIIEEYREKSNQMGFRFFGNVTRLMEVVYEVEIEKYYADEIQLNPFYSNQNNGFVAISYRNKTKADNIEMSVNPNETMKQSGEPIFIRAKITDSKKRAVANEKIKIYRDEIFLKEINTNSSGEVFYYDNDNSLEEKQYIYSVEHNNGEKIITEVENLKTIHENENERFYIVSKANKNKIIPNNSEEVEVTFIMKNKFGNAANSKSVKVTIVKNINGTKDKEILNRTTDSEGKVKINIKAEKETEGYIHVLCEYDHFEEKAFSEFTIKVIG